MHVITHWKKYVVIAALCPLGGSVLCAAPLPCTQVTQADRRISLTVPPLVQPEVEVVRWQLVDDSSTKGSSGQPRREGRTPASAETSPSSVAGTTALASESTAPPPFELDSKTRTVLLVPDLWQTETLQVEALGPDGAVLCSAEVSIRAAAQVAAAVTGTPPSLGQVLQGLGSVHMLPGAPARGHVPAPPTPTGPTLPASVLGNYEEITVYYLSERAPKDKDFDVIRDTHNQIYYGKVKVYIPRVPPSQQQLPTDYHRLPLPPESLGPEGFNAAILHDPRFLQSKSVLVYVHGFFNGFKEEAYKLALLTYESGYRGVPVVFDWPSAESPLDYGVDVKRIKDSESTLKSLLIRVASLDPTAHVSLLAHSLGNRLLLNTLSSMNAAASPKFDQLILAAPDVGSAGSSDTSLPSLIGPFVRSHLFRGITIYGSSHDHAMWASWIVNLRRPAGFLPPGAAIAGVDQVNISNLPTNRIGHDYFVTCPQIAKDIGLVLNDGKPAPRDPMRSDTGQFPLFFYDKP